jgi:ubiquinone/menaquinone biosynthesis C-methylase UbiE
VGSSQDLFDLIFLFGGKGNPRRGLQDAIPDQTQLVLDLCVGTASSSILLACEHAGNQIVGIDISDAMLSVAERKIARKKITNLRVQNMSAMEMQFADESFDAVMVSFELHEFDQQARGKVFREVSRVLKVGGRFCVVDFARQDNPRNRAFLKVWTMIEPPGFRGFLDLDWRMDLTSHGLCYEREIEFSFSNLFLLRKH